MLPGAAVFSYNKAQNLFCYVPISSVEGWYLVSIIPNSVILDQASNIINWTLLLCGLITVLILAIILIYNPVRFNVLYHDLTPLML